MCSSDGQDATAAASKLRQPSIKTDEVKSMIADVDSLLSKSDDLDSLLSPSKTSKSAASSAAVTDANNQSMQAVEELEALLK